LPLAIQRALDEINAKNTSRGAPQLSARIGPLCPHRAFGVVLLRLRIAEEGHQSIAEPFEDMTAEPGHRLRRLVKVGVH
jgi:hypothetical protein